ncbi:hypothetical protein HDV05_008127 [Chytridiales sp. JEL 0842]|nr:hypothetical protein HDV05_008127 [Chytridiales sp. JEL 0842]
MISIDELRSEAKVQSHMNNVISSVLTTLSTKTSVKYHDFHRKFMNDPRLSPDCAFTVRSVLSPTWSNTILLGELKSAAATNSGVSMVSGGSQHKVGLGQALRYARAVLQHQSDRKKIVVFFSDLLSIQFAVFGEKNVISDTFQFIGGSEVTIGFELFVNVLGATFENLGYLYADSVELDEITFPIYNTLGSGAHNIVYDVLHGGQHFALKVPKSKDRSMTLIQQEKWLISEVKALLGNENLDVSFLPTVVHHKRLRHGLLLTAIGEPLKANYQSQVYEASNLLGPNRRLPILKSISRQMLAALHSLWKIGYFHGDVRPSNWIVAENDAVVLIDWEGSSREKSPAHIYTVHFASDNLLNYQGGRYSYSIYDDLETWIYSLIVLDDPGLGLPWLSAATVAAGMETSPLTAALDARTAYRLEYFKRGDPISVMIKSLWEILQHNAGDLGNCFYLLELQLQ